VTPEKTVEHVNTLIEHSPRVRILWEAWEQSRRMDAPSTTDSKAWFAEWFTETTGAQAMPFSDKLSVREQEVAELLVLGQTCREIAEKLGVSVKTIDTHRGHILKKIGVRNNVELTRRAMGLSTP
jgi:DNA-binding NarL/FixJ family response regulator